MKARAQWLVGKTIESVDFNPFGSGKIDSRGNEIIAHDPVIRFTDGSVIWFVTQETEAGLYGTAIAYRGRRRKKT